MSISNIGLESGRYVLAVSGGVDSMVMMHALNRMRPKTDGLELIVGHYDHGIRPDSGEDAEFVESIAKDMGLVVEIGRGHLGPEASEEQARVARYAFLEGIRNEHMATAVITAHHQDDLLETAVINLIRGTGRHGLSSLQSRQGMLRPMLGFCREQILAYADAHGVAWREDPTNQDVRYLRNQVRLDILPLLSSDQRRMLLDTCIRVGELNTAIDAVLEEMLTYKSYRRCKRVYKRSWYNALPHYLSREVVYAWLRQHNLHDYGASNIDRLALHLKVARAGKRLVVGDDRYFELSKRSIRLHL